MPKQKLELTWIGKDNRPRLEPRILLCDPEKSYHAARRVTEHDEFDNRLIFGDNLLALKALEQEFTGKIKCIYIDPPFNTQQAMEHYDDGLEHSIWLTLMQDRLALKLEDGVRLHENTKLELKNYAFASGEPEVKPFMLVVARDVEHANALMATIQENAFFAGQYKDRVITVHSSLRGEEKDETVEKLLSVESPANPTEIVIHVNMLKEGWDVTNLYTIVPLRAADSKTLVEQSIGRGLRLPYGQRVGVPAVDRLTIVAHDRFQAIVDEANKPGSVLRVQEVVIGRDIDLTPKTTMIVEPVFMRPPATPPGAGHALQGTETERKVMHSTFEVIRRYERDVRRVPQSSALRSEELRKEIAAQVAAELAPQQPFLPGMDNAAALTAVIDQSIDRFIALTIDIPRIILAPAGEVVAGYDDFDLDLTNQRPQPVSQKILIQHLSDNARELLGDADLPVHEARLEDYLIRGLIDFDDVCYDDHAALLYNWCGQVVRHLQSYLSAEDDVRNVLLYH